MAIGTQKSSLVFYGVLLVIALGIVGGAIMFGQSDKGQIDVSAAIANSNAERQAAADATGEAATGVTPPPVSTAPNGGLVGKGDTSTPPPDTEAPESANASTTDEATALDGDAPQAEPSGDEESGTEESVGEAGSEDGATSQTEASATGEVAQ